MLLDDGGMEQGTEREGLSFLINLEQLFEKYFPLEQRYRATFTRNRPHGETDTHGAMTFVAELGDMRRLGSPKV